jgi:hypothetical protein
VFVRRFFIFDTVSGLGPRSTDEIIAGAAWIPKVTRYPKSINLIVNLDQELNEMLNVPYLTIDYRER